MADRLSPLDASFLFMEESTTAMHVGGLMTFDATPGFDPDRFVAQIGQRLAAVPRYRQKIREVPVHLGLPVWVDDPGFELDYHVRRSALPAPGIGRAAARARRPPHVAASSTGPGRCGRSTWSRGCPTAGSRSSPRSTTRWSTGCRRSTSARCSSTSRPTPRESRPTTGSPRPSRPASSSPRTRCRSSCCRPQLMFGTAQRAPARRPVGGAHRRRRCSRRAVGVAAAPGQPAQRADRRAAPLRHGRRRPRRLQGASAKRTAARSTTSCCRRRRERCGGG